MRRHCTEDWRLWRKARYIPVDRACKPLAYPQQRPVSEQALRLVDVGLRKAHVAGAKLAIDRTKIAQVGIPRLQQRTDQLEELIKRSSFAQRDVVDLVDGGRVIGQGRQQIRLHHVVDMAEIASRFA